jgi:hypothetical protein
MRPAYHTIVVSLVTGLFFFALVAVAVRVLLRFRGEEESPLATYADRAAVGAAAIGVALTLIGIITGFLIWPLEATLRSPVMKNKILSAFLIVAFWGAYLVVRFRRGPGLWRHPAMAVYAGALAASGFAFGMITSSIGGDAAGNPSGFENIVRIFGVETRFTFYLPTWLNILIIVLGVGALVLGFTARSTTKTTERVEAQR